MFAFHPYALEAIPEAQPLKAIATKLLPQSHGPPVPPYPLSIRLATGSTEGHVFDCGSFSDKSRTIQLPSNMVIYTSLPVTIRLQSTSRHRHKWSKVANVMEKLSHKIISSSVEKEEKDCDEIDEHLEYFGEHTMVSFLSKTLSLVQQSGASNDDSGGSDAIFNQSVLFDANGAYSLRLHVMTYLVDDLFRFQPVSLRLLSRSMSFLGNSSFSHDVVHSSCAQEKNPHTTTTPLGVFSSSDLQGGREFPQNNDLVTKATGGLMIRLKADDSLVSQFIVIPSNELECPSSSSSLSKRDESSALKTGEEDRRKDNVEETVVVTKNDSAVDFQFDDTQTEEDVEGGEKENETGENEEEEEEEEKSGTKETSKARAEAILLKDSRRELYLLDSTRRRVLLLSKTRKSRVFRSILQSSDGHITFEYVVRVSREPISEGRALSNRSAFKHRAFPLKKAFTDLHRIVNDLKAQEEDMVATPTRSEVDATDPIQQRMARDTPFSSHSQNNDVDFIIDGENTFRRVYESMMDAQHSICLLGWELSPDIGVVRQSTLRAEMDEMKEKREKNKEWNSESDSNSSLPLLHPHAPPPTTPLDADFVSLADVLLHKASQGVKVRAVVWRPSFLIAAGRRVPILAMPVEKEILRMEKRAKAMNLSFKVIHSVQDGAKRKATVYEAKEMEKELEVLKNSGKSSYDIVMALGGEPRGVFSSHHEKLQLIDGECSNHGVAFVGGFDIANARWNTSEHKLEVGNFRLEAVDWKRLFLGSKSEKTDENADDDGVSTIHSKKEKEEKEKDSQPSSKKEKDTKRPNQNLVSFLWHDTQLMMRGDVVQQMRSHFQDRWMCLFSQAKHATGTYGLPPVFRGCDQHEQITKSVLDASPSTVRDCDVRVLRNWSLQFDTTMFHEFRTLLSAAKKYLYVEHLYAFQNATLAYSIIRQLHLCPSLRLLVVTNVQTDMPTGVFGDLIDCSQDHVMDNLEMIYNSAPGRVGIYGVVSNTTEVEDTVQPVYVHSKVVIIDDEVVLDGSLNMDNGSFFHFSELCCAVYSEKLATSSRRRLAQEHLEERYRPEMDIDFGALMGGFKEAAEENEQIFLNGGSKVKGRIVYVCPRRSFDLVDQHVYHPGSVEKGIAMYFSYLYA